MAWAFSFLKKYKMIQKQATCLFYTAWMLLFPLYSIGQALAPSPKGKDLRVQGNSLSLFAQAFKSDNMDAYPILVVALHGDAPPPYENPDYQNIFAAKIAELNPGVIAIGLLRPGYSDPEGNRSDGMQGKLNGDNWNATNTNAIADAICNLKTLYKAQKVVVAGHSGGAAIAANMLGRHPDLIDAALLVSCPCADVESWRRHMLELTDAPVFKGRIKTLSPIEQIEGVFDKVPITLMVGTDDKVAPPSFSEAYEAAALEAGKTVTLIKIEGEPHNVFLHPHVYESLTSIITDIKTGDGSRR